MQAWPNRAVGPPQGWSGGTQGQSRLFGHGQAGGLGSAEAGEEFCAVWIPSTVAFARWCSPEHGACYPGTC